MSEPLVKPTKEIFLNVIAELEKDRDAFCCLNCYEVNDTAVKCQYCRTSRCDMCRPIHRKLEKFLVVYGVLELGLGTTVLESLLRVYHIDVAYCDGCCA